VLGRKVFLASGMMVHEVSVLLVTLNAMRLLGYDKKTFLGKLIKA
jgi:Cd2+/Zn2+-exporting ATPase